jgi:hypothetical protein
MTNEALAKILNHNICCLIQSHYELGIEATFLGKEDVISRNETAEINPVEAWVWL